MEALAFTLAYLIIILMLLWFTISDFFSINKFRNKYLNVWIYGTCEGRKARKHKYNKNVQFILWKKGQQGHTEDYWHNFDESWWKLFKKENK